MIAFSSAITNSVGDTFPRLSFSYLSSIQQFPTFFCDEKHIFDSSFPYLMGGRSFTVEDWCTHQMINSHSDICILSSLTALLIFIVFISVVLSLLTLLIFT